MFPGVRLCFTYQRCISCVMQLSSLVSGAPKSAGIQQPYIESHSHPSWVTGHPSIHQSEMNMTSALVSNPYANQQNINYTYSQAQQRPPSPPSDESKKCSLPSISSLIESVSPENGTISRAHPRRIQLTLNRFRSGATTEWAINSCGRRSTTTISRPRFILKREQFPSPSTAYTSTTARFGI